MLICGGVASHLGGADLPGVNGHPHSVNLGKGMTSQEVSRLVNSAVAEGILNGNQAQMLLKQFAGK